MNQKKKTEPTGTETQAKIQKKASATQRHELALLFSSSLQKKKNPKSVKKKETEEPVGDFGPKTGEKTEEKIQRKNRAINLE